MLSVRLRRSLREIDAKDCSPSTQASKPLSSEYSYIIYELCIETRSKVFDSGTFLRSRMLLVPLEGTFLNQSLVGSYT